MSIVKTGQRYIQTLRKLRTIQLVYQIRYRIIPLNVKRILSLRQFSDTAKEAYQELQLAPVPIQNTEYIGSNTFRILNIEHSFDQDVDWNLLDHGKLWAYHLNYFQFLHQDKMDVETGLSFMRHFADQIEKREEGLEPYPTSLRTIQWIKFFAFHKVYPESLVQSLRIQYAVLLRRLEYHLLGNHLLENGLSLAFGGIFIRDSHMIGTAERILDKELDRQFLMDGGHVERSPMYQCILLERVMDLYNLMIHNEHSMKPVENKLRSVIENGLGWLKKVQFQNGDLPWVNDATPGQALDLAELLDYAGRLDLRPEFNVLRDSGYRKWNPGPFELFVDVGEIGLSYQPGHAHCDTLSFLLYAFGEPVLVDPGITTYEKGAKRHFERSTRNHNTVVINDDEQSDIWGGFRVGRRAYPRILTEESEKLVAEHNGYRHIPATHRRGWVWDEQHISISDEVFGVVERSYASFHVHPGVNVKQTGRQSFILGRVKVEFRGATRIKITDYEMATGFNQSETGKRLAVDFDYRLQTIFRV